MSRTTQLPAVIYCDGGVIGRNPSIIGGTWSFCWVNPEGIRIREESGVVFPVQTGRKTVSNNFTELYAALMAMKSVPRKWDGIIYTDSRVTAKRISKGRKFLNISQDMKQAVLFYRKGLFTVGMVAGHPSEDDLIQGYKSGRKNVAVSVHNVWCDQQCGMLAKKVKRGEIASCPSPLLYGEKLSEGFGL